MTPIIAFAAVSPDVSEREDIIINEDVSQRLSRYNFQQICNEINSISKKGVELPDLLFHSAALAEKINSVSEDELFEIIKNKQNSENLRIISIQLLDYPNYYSKVMTVSGASTANGATIVQMTASSDASKRWNLVPASP